MSERIAIYGGSFSPPHLGHFCALKGLIQQEKPDTTLLIPALVPPHKQLKGNASPEQRMEMCRLAFNELPVTVSDIELRRGGTSYTVLTLRELKRSDNTLLLLCGTDMFLTLDTWYMPKEIFSLAEIIYMRREDVPEVADELHAKAEFYQKTYGAITRELVYEPLAISSTELRQMIAEGKDTSEYLHPTVREYIEKCQLYQI